MTHDDARNRLDEYFDGELPPALAADVDHHVRACSHCQAALARRADLSRSLSGTAVQPPSTAASASRPQDGGDFVQSVLAAIASERETRGAGWTRWVMPSLGAGLATAVVGIGIGLTTMREEPAAAGSDPVDRIEQESEASLAGLESARNEDADQGMLLAMEED